MKLLLTVTLAALVLTGCAKREGRPKIYNDDVAVANMDPKLQPPPAPILAPEPASPDAPPDLEARGMGPAQAPAPSQKPLAVQPTLAMLAYSYSDAIEAPAAKVERLQHEHEQACVSAGPTVCQIINRSITRNDDLVNGSLTLKATPAWLSGFRDGLAGQAKAAGGKVLKSSVESEDLARDIVDSEATLRAKTTLRDRLQTLLADHPGKVGDLLAVERELARVQGEIDAGQSELTVMKGRVAMSQASISYSSTGVLARASAWTPLGQAAQGFLGIIAGSLAAMIIVFGAALPWLVLAAVSLWLGRRQLPRLARLRPKLRADAKA